MFNKNNSNYIYKLYELYKEHLFKAILSKRNTVAEQISNLNQQLETVSSIFNFFKITIDEIVDTIRIAQLATVAFWLVNACNIK